MSHSLRDLSHPDYTPLDVPEWAREEGPEWVDSYRGVNGLPDVWQTALPGANAMGTRGIDRYQANHFITWCPETALYLKDHYTPLDMKYRQGTFPRLELVAAEAADFFHTAEEKVESLLSGPARRLKHPMVPPLGPPIPGSRNMDEEEILQSEVAWCNEQARVFVRLCQTQNIPARIIHLFYNQVPSGHTVVEIYTGSSWCLVDASYFILFRDENGRCLSAADCHDRGPGQKRFGELYFQALQGIIAETEYIPEKSRPDRAVKWLKERSGITPQICSQELDFFGVMNYPLPGVPTIEPFSL